LRVNAATRYTLVSPVRRAVHPAKDENTNWLKKAIIVPFDRKSPGPTSCPSLYFGAPVADSPAASFADLLRSRNFPARSILPQWGCSNSACRITSQIQVSRRSLAEGRGATAAIGSGTVKESRSRRRPGSHWPLRSIDHMTGGTAEYGWSL
jgi:hypothetical protein